jgi:nucleotide-binding universal stress UspA family protein/GNAT superfamily N-acetyltransferase
METGLELADGSRVTVRQIRADDRSRLVQGFERLGAESRRRRFFTAISALSEAQLDYLTNVDHHDHEALVAFDVASGEGVGVARWVRTAPEEAEPAIVVADAWQRKGLGRRLLALLRERARDEGITRFVAPVLVENSAAIALLEELGGTTRRTSGPELELIIELPAERPLDTLLRAVAEGTVIPASRLWDRVTAQLRSHAAPATAPASLAQSTLVVGTDGSADARAAVHRAAEIAVALDAQVRVVAARRTTENRDELQAALDDTARRLASQGLDARTELVEGDPVTALLDVAAAERASLVIVGASARKPTLGSVSHALATRAHCDLLIVRAEHRDAP